MDGAFGQHKGGALWEGWVPLARLSHFGYTPPAIISAMGIAITTAARGSHDVSEDGGQLIAGMDEAAMPQRR